MYKTCDDCSVSLAVGPWNTEIKYAFGNELYVHIVSPEYRKESKEMLTVISNYDIILWDKTK